MNKKIFLFRIAKNGDILKEDVHSNETSALRVSFDSNGKEDRLELLSCGTILVSQKFEILSEGLKKLLDVERKTDVNMHPGKQLIRIYELIA